MAGFYAGAAERVRYTCQDEVRTTTVGLYASILTAICFTVAMSLLSFAALSAWMPTALALLVALALHGMAIFSAHHATVSAILPGRWTVIGGAWMVLACLAALCAYALAMARALVWLEGNLLLAAGLAVIEPASVFVAGFLTSMQQDRRQAAISVLRRAASLHDACAATTDERRAARAWANSLDSAQAELSAIVAETAANRRAADRRAEIASRLAGYIALLSSYATSAQAKDDQGVEQGTIYPSAQPATN